MALSADKKRLYVACSDTNDIAVIDISGDRNRVLGFIPAAGYPTAVAGLAEGRLAVLNGHGNSVQLVDAPGDADLISYSGKVMAGFAYKDPAPDAAAAPRPAIRHVVYVVRGEPEADAETVNWATAGIAPDFTARLAPATAAGRRKIYDFEGQEPANAPPAGYLWNAASQAGVKMRNYGFQVHNLAKANADGEQVDRVYDPALSESTDMEYRGMDAAYPDSDRAKEFASEMKEYDQLDAMPSLLLVRIGKDEQALATMTDAVKKSKFWSDTAMFVVTGDRAAAVSPVAGLKTSGSALSALRTVELILGLNPMTVFDAAAAPMF